MNARDMEMSTVVYDDLYFGFERLGQRATDIGGSDKNYTDDDVAAVLRLRELLREGEALVDAADARRKGTR